MNVYLIVISGQVVIPRIKLSVQEKLNLSQTILIVRVSVRDTIVVNSSENKLEFPKIFLIFVGTK